MQPAPLPEPDTDPTPIVTAGELMGASRVVRIRHGAEEYRLQLTKSGKLILTK